MKKILLGFFMIFSITSIAQESGFEFQEYKNKGKFFAYWGWNRENYSTSDISFKGDNYNFTLKDVAAHEKVKPFALDPYLHPLKITIPQTNLRIGYFFKENYSVSVGVDHMKYVMYNNRIGNITGTINTGGDFDGIYTNDEILVSEDFLTFEYTDGLNYINVEVDRFDNIDKFLNFKVRGIDIAVTEGIGVGLMYPKSNTKILGKERYDDFNVAGWGMSAHVGINITAFKHFFIQSNLKVGYIDMDNIRTTKNTNDSASQHFTFIERSILFGGRFRLF
ncbi:MAG: hypothetical protein COB60_03940 [Flavobacteriaceae bacterium]|nr:MAG: hypothetical protein COB60_03940 [Flavobacteriaceae bacterium]